MIDWPMTSLDSILLKSEDWITPEADKEYKEVTVRLWGKGVVLRGKVSGSKISGTRRLRVRANQFILSRIDARNGATGLVPELLDGAVVTNDFPAYGLNTERIYPPFLDWMSKTGTFVDLCKRASEGTTNRVRLQEDRFLSTNISLPPLPEQQRIVARIECLAEKIDEVNALRRLSAQEADALKASASNALFSTKSVSAWPTVPLGEIAEIRSGVTLGRTLKGPTVRLPYLRVANVQDGHLNLSHVKEIEILESEIDKWLLRPGDVLMTEGGDWDKLGRGTVWRGEIKNCIHQNHIFRVRTNHSEFDPEYLKALIGSPYGKAYFQEASKQTTNLASINQQELKAFNVFRISLKEQHQIVTYLDGLQVKVDALKKVQSETAAELVTLLPSVLDKAFKGQL